MLANTPKTILFISLLSLINCGGGGSSSDSGQPQVSTGTGQGAFQIKFAKDNSDWHNGEAYRNQVTATGSHDSLTFRMLYGPGGMSINDKGEINWDGQAIGFGQLYSIAFGVEASNGSQSRELHGKLKVDEQLNHTSKLLTFYEGTLYLNNDLHKLKVLPGENGKESLVASLDSQGDYTVVTLNDAGEVAVKRRYFYLEQGQSVTSFGLSATPDTSLVIAERDESINPGRAHYLYSKTNNNAENTSTQELKLPAKGKLFNIDGDRGDEIVITHYSDRAPESSQLTIDVYDQKLSSIYTRKFNVDDSLINPQPSYACDQDGDGTSELMISGRLYNVSSGASYTIGDSAVPIKNPKTGLCDTFIRLPDGLSDQPVQLRWRKVAHNNEANIISQKLVKLPQDTESEQYTYTLGESPVVIADKNNNRTFVLIYKKTKKTIEASLIATLDADRQSLSVKPISFENKIGATISSEDVFLGFADFDGDGKTELLVKHWLKPGDNDYSSIYETEREEVGAPHVLVIAEMTSDSISPKHLSEVFLSGRIGLYSLAPNGRLLLNNNNTALVLSENKQFERLPNIPESVKGASYFLKNNKSLHYNEELTLYNKDGSVAWSIPKASLFLEYEDFKSILRVSETIYDDAHIASINFFVDKNGNQNKHVFIDLQTGKVLGSVYGQISRAPNFNRTGYFFLPYQSENKMGFYQVNKKGVKLVHDWSKVTGLPFYNYDHLSWVDVDQDGIFEVALSRQVVDGLQTYPLRDIRGEVKKTIQITYSGIDAEFEKPPVFSNQCLAWDPECRLSIEISNKGVITAIDRQTQRIVWKVTHLELAPRYNNSWFSDFRAGGEKVLLINSLLDVNWYY